MSREKDQQQERPRTSVIAYVALLFGILGTASMAMSFITSAAAPPGQLTRHFLSYYSAPQINACPNTGPMTLNCASLHCSDSFGCPSPENYCDGVDVGPIVVTNATTKVQITGTMAAATSNGTATFSSVFVDVLTSAPPTVWTDEGMGSCANNNLVIQFTIGSREDTFTSLGNSIGATNSFVFFVNATLTPGTYWLTQEVGDDCGSCLPPFVGWYQAAGPLSNMYAEWFA